MQVFGTSQRRQCKYQGLLHTPYIGWKRIVCGAFKYFILTYYLVFKPLEQIREMVMQISKSVKSQFLTQKSDKDLKLWKEYIFILIMQAHLLKWMKLMPSENVN